MLAAGEAGVILWPLEREKPRSRGRGHTNFEQGLGHANVSDRMDAAGHLPPRPREDRTRVTRRGGELFAGRTWDGNEVTLVCFDDGYVLRRNGEPVPGRRWGVDQVDAALAAFRAVAFPSVRLVIPPPAA